MKNIRLVIGIGVLVLMVLVVVGLVSAQPGVDKASDEIIE